MTKAEYLKYRNEYVPPRRNIIFVLESPPASGRYFYNPDGPIGEPLFGAMMNDVLGISPRSKYEGLEEFASRGFLLIDSTYTPVNQLEKRDRNNAIHPDFPQLIDELRDYASPETGIVLVKANVCELLEPKLVGAGFTVLNRGNKIPFPSTGQQAKFRSAIRSILNL